MTKENKKKLGGLVVFKNNLWMLKRILKYSPSYVIVTVIAGIIMGINNCINTLYIMKLLDYLDLGKSLESVLSLIGGYAIYLICYFAAQHWYYQVFKASIKEVFHKEICCDMFCQAARLDLERYDDPEFYDDFIWAMEQSYTRAARLMDDTEMLITRLITSITLISLFFSIDPLIAVVIIVVSVARVIFTSFQNKVNGKYYDDINPLNRKDNYIKRVFMLPDYSKELRATKVSEALFDEYDQNTSKKDAVVLKYAPQNITYKFLGMLFPMIGETLLYIILIYKIMFLGTMTLGGLAVAINGIWKVSWSLRDLTVRIMGYHEHAIFIEKIIKFMNNSPQIASGKLEVPKLEQLEIKDLDFSYFKDGKEIKALDGVSMKIKRGEKIAIVGYNGAGKTTLTKLVMRLYDPQRGSILYNGKDLREYSIKGLRDKTVAVFQDYKIFAATIAENVAGGECDEKDTNRVEKALEGSVFKEKLKSLPKGIETLLTREFDNSGTELSGGEQQKIAIARAFYKDAELMILDEPSSALDPDAEYNLNRSISQYADDKTVIFISHRLSTTRHADRIYMFDSGKIIESGTHEELMKMGGKYAYMFNLQAEKYLKSKKMNL